MNMGDTKKARQGNLIALFYCPRIKELATPSISGFIAPLVVEQAISGFVAGFREAGESPA
jgi:hypothetical protein